MDTTTGAGLLDRLHAAARRRAALRTFTWMVRILLAVPFVPYGLIKIMNLPFTSVSTQSPIGGFFAALQQADLLYRYIGFGQLLAGVLLLIPRTAAVGAVAYFPIISGILALNVALDFGNTTYVSALMLLGNLYLLCWDYDRLTVLVRRPTAVTGGAG